MNKNTLYERYHLNRRLQKRLISDWNFTYRNLIDILGKYLSEKRKILDIGCGTGTVSFYIAAKGISVTGIDISANAITIAKVNSKFLGVSSKTKYFIKFFPQDKIRGKFDLIICSEVLEHLKEDKFAVKEMYSLLKENGILILSTPSSNGPLYKLGFTKTHDRLAGHLRRYTIQSLIETVSSEGFIYLYSKKTEGLLRNLFFVFPIFGQVIRIANKFKFVSDLITFLDDITLYLFGESQIYLVVRKRHGVEAGIDGRQVQLDITGVGKYVKNLIGDITVNGIKYVVFCDSQPKFKIRSRKVRYKILKTKNSYYFEQVLLPLALRGEGVNFYHATNNCGVPFFYSCPVVTTIHDIIPLTLEGYFNGSKFPLASKLLYKFKIQMSLWLSKKVICTDSINARAILKNFIVNGKKISIIPMAVSNVFFKKRKGRLKKPYILNHGGIDQRKNIKRLIEAFSLSKNLDLVITGTNPKMVKDLKILAGELKISDRVKFIGWVSEERVAALVGNAKCVVYPTLAEGFGLPMLEAMAAGTPVVVSNIPILKKIGKDIPVYVNPNNTKSIYGGIMKAVSGIPKSRLSRGKTIAGNYTWEKTAEKTSEVYFETMFDLNR